MTLKCRIAGHGRAEQIVYNSGYYFGRCSDCGADLIRTGRGGWEPVPAGHVVTWKSGSRHSHSLPADFAGLLPIALEQPGAKLPATQNRFFSWSRALATLAPRRWLRRQRRQRRHAAVAVAPSMPNEIEEKPVPGLLVAVLLFGASLRFVWRLGRR